MQNIASIIHFFILAMIFVMPILLPLVLRRKNLLWCALVSLCLSGLLVVMFAYWPHLYADLRLGYLGFDFDGWSDEDRARNVAPEFREEATKLYWSNMGIGWPLQAIFGLALLFPYQAIASGLVFLIKQVDSRARIT